tara:strand:- start:373 stop:1509 length:1137 start_codon:yes stop_codon:yes gene_type:complete
MAWKKIIVSGSTAALGTLTVDNSVTANSFAGNGANITNIGFDNIVNVPSGIISSSTQQVSGLLNQDLNLGTGTFEASVISGSTISGSFVGNGSGLSNLTIDQTVTVIQNFTDQTTVTVVHNFESNNVLATVYDSDGYQIIPASVRSNQEDRVVITFAESTSGKVIVGKGGHIVSGSIPFTNILSKPTLFSGSAQVQINDTTGTLTTLGTVTAGDVSAILPSGTVSGSSIASSAQGEVALTTNGTAASAIDLGLQTSDSPTFASLTLTGDLTVQGTTTSIQTSNLLVEDKFILLNSGSANPDEGGILIDEGSGQGHAYVYDSNATRFGYTGSLAFDATSVTPDAFAAAVVDIDAGHVDKAEYQKNGNIKTDSGVIFIYA